MPICHNQGAAIHYEVHGSGKPVVLIHGVAVNFATNYAAFGWTELLTENGFQVIGLDLRGHGASDKPQSSADYSSAILASDVLAVLDELSIEQAAVVGYSLGSAITLYLAQHFPERVNKAILIATGDGLIGLGDHSIASTGADLKEAVSRDEYPKDLPAHVATYWNFVEHSGGCRKAVAALMDGNFEPATAQQASQIHVPTVVISGALDLVLGQGSELAASLGNCRYIEIAEADHFNLALLDEVKSEVTRSLTN